MLLLEGLCLKSVIIWKMLGTLVNVLKIIIPIIIIVLGMIDFGKAVLSSDDKGMSKATGALIRRIIAGVVVFFIPTIISAIFNIIDVSIGEDTDYNICVQCLVKHNGNTCTNAVAEYNELKKADSNTN